MEIFWVVVVIFLAVFTQSVSGFGVALVAMALLPDILGVKGSAPLVALVALTLELFLLWRYRRSVQWSAVTPIILASAVGVPLGIWMLKGLDEKIVLSGLGLVLCGYALYGLFNFKLPKLNHPLWTYLTGLVAGILGGAYNTSGPPVIIYGNCRRWSPEEFKGNLQGFFVLNSILVVLMHGVNHNLVHGTWIHYFWALPAIFLGLWSGVFFDRYLKPQTFGKLVLWLLVIMGVKLLATSGWL